MSSDETLQTLHQAAKLALREQRFKDALHHLERAIGHNPTDVLSQTLSGIAYQRLGQKDAALRAFSRAVELDPTDAVAQFNLGQMHHLMNDDETAIERLILCLEIDPGHKAAKELKDALLKARA